jgi:regulator of sirC expression with transglutaminase-like and TPR domain
MSKTKVAQPPNHGKTRPSESKTEPRPTELEHAELTTHFVDFDHCQDENPLRVLVAAEKTARALQFAIQGMNQELDHSMTREEDIDILAEMATGLWLFCNQAKTLAAKQATPAAAGGAR